MQKGSNVGNKTNELLQEIISKLTVLNERAAEQAFALNCCALALGIMWGAMTWALLLWSKNEREFF